MIQHIYQTDQGTDHTPGRTHGRQCIPEANRILMSTLHADQFRLHNRTYQFGIGSIDDQKNSFLQKRVIQVGCCFFQRKQAFLTCHIGKLYDLTDHIRSIQCGRFEDQCERFQTSYVILQTHGREGTGKCSAKGNDRRSRIQIFPESSHTCGTYDTKYQHE